MSLTLQVPDQVALPALPATGDVAKAKRFIRAVPLDARWIKSLRMGLPIKRISNSHVEAAFKAHDALIDDVIAFQDTEVMEAYQVLVDALEALCNEFQGMFSPEHDGGDYLEVPPEWQRTDHEGYYKALSDLSSARGRFLQHYDALVNLLNGKDLLTWPGSASAPAT
ncbi:hypothetical protein ACWGQ5_49430 [Streptomyces sp. NPDC055722]